VSEEGLKIQEDALRVIVRQSTGCLRDAISLLDQLTSSGERITLDLVQSVLGTATSEDVVGIANALVDGDASAGLGNLHKALDRGVDPRQFARQVVEYLRALLLVKMGGKSEVDATEDMRNQMEKHVNTLTVQTLLRCIRIFNRAAVEGRELWQPALALEMAMIEAVTSDEMANEGEKIFDRGIQSIQTQDIQHTPPSGIPVATGETFAPGQPSVIKTEKVVTNTDDVALLQQISVNWRQIASTAHQRNPQTQGLLRSCKPLGIRSDCLILGCNNQFVKGQMETTENVGIARWAIAQVLHREMDIKCVLSSGEQEKLPPGVDSDGMVAAALDLGGKVIREVKSEGK